MPHLDRNAMDGIGVFALFVLLVPDIQSGDQANGDKQSLHQKFSRESNVFAEAA
jgi:predicted RNA-binding protein with TRAM domain